MKKLILVLWLLPAWAWAAVSGMDDLNANINKEVQQKLDTAITTYYQHPSVEKVDTILDLMNDTRLLRKKTAWAPMIGFLSVIFEHNKKHIFEWMSRNDYNSYAEDIFITSLMHAKLHEAALVFAQAHQWGRYQIDRLRQTSDTLDLKHLEITLPGHVDTLWGAFFASGDPVYVNRILDALSTGTTLSLKDASGQQLPSRALSETRGLIQNTLWAYGPSHKPVHDAMQTRLAKEKDQTTRELLQQLLAKHEQAVPPAEPQPQ
jgi:hypothetical protein